MLLRTDQKPDVMTETEDLRGFLRNYINEHCIYRVKPEDPLLYGNIPGSRYSWQFYLRRGLTNGEVLRAVAKLFWEKFLPLYEAKPFQLAGIETGATPLAAALAFSGPPGLNCFMIRQDPKKYGLYNRFEGIINYDLPVLLIDDLCGSKKSMLKASWRCAENGLSLYDCAFAVVNKYTGRGPHPDMAKAIGPKFKVHTLFDLNDFDLDHEVYRKWHGHPPPEWRLDAVTYHAGIGKRHTMLDYIYGHDKLVADFVAQLIPECRERGFGNCKAIGVIDSQGKLIGGLVYRNWCPEVGTIEISGAAIPGTNWLSRRTIQIMYDYPFYQCDCQMVIKTTMADNEIVLRIMAAVGFSLHYIKRLGGRDKDGVVGTLTREDWENSRYNFNRKREQHSEAA